MDAAVRFYCMFEAHVNAGIHSTCKLVRKMDACFHFLPMKVCPMEASGRGGNWRFMPKVSTTQDSSILYLSPNFVKGSIFLLAEAA